MKPLNVMLKELKRGGCVIYLQNEAGDFVPPERKTRLRYTFANRQCAYDALMRYKARMEKANEKMD